MARLFANLTTYCFSLLSCLLLLSFNHESTSLAATKASPTTRNKPPHAPEALTSGPPAPISSPPTPLQEQPFSDVYGRFFLRLPVGWEYAPQPGDIYGAFFKRQKDHFPAYAGVKVFNFNSIQELDIFASHIRKSSNQEPGYKLLLQNPTSSLGGLPAIYERFVIYISGNPKMPKIVEQYVAVKGTMGYVLRTETIVEAFDVFSREFQQIYDNFSLTPLAPLSESSAEAVTSARKRAAENKIPASERIIGGWLNNIHKLQFSPSKIYLLDDEGGTYRVEGSLLILKDTNNHEQVYQYKLTGDLLRLEGGVFGNGQDFKRLH